MIVSGTTFILGALAILVAAAAIVTLMGRYAPRSKSAPPADDDGIDRAALEQAEREVMGMESEPGGKPSDDVIGDDWGPGAGRTPLG